MSSGESPDAASSRDRPSAERIPPIDLVTLSCGIGAPDPMCALGPEALLSAGLDQRLRARGRVVDVQRLPACAPTMPAPVSASASTPPPPPMPPSGGSPLPFVTRRADDAVTEALRQACDGLAQVVARSVAGARVPLVLGGDHACAIGTWKGLARALAARGPVGLVWLDAHLDAHTPETTESGMLHGMPLAVLFGHGDRRLVGLAGGASIEPRHVCLIGARSYESGEAQLLARLGVRVIDMAEVETRGIGAALAEGVAIASAAAGGWGLSIDVDAIDPLDAPGVGTPVERGIGAAALAAELRGLSARPGFVAAELVEYNPTLDPDGRTGDVAARLLAAVFAPEGAA